MFRRVLNAINAMFFGQVISRLSSFLLVPLFLSYWSPTIYGEWLALFALVGYLASLDVGVQLAAVNRLTADYSRGDSRGYQQVQHSALALYVGIALVGSVVALVALLVLPIPKWIGIRATGSSTARTVLIILALYVLWAMPARVITSVYRTVGRLAKSEWLYNVQMLIAALLTGVLLVTGRGMVTIALISLLLQIVVVAYVLFDIRKNLPELMAGFGQANRAAIKQLIDPSAMFALMSFSVLITSQGAVLLVSVFLGGLTVAVFSVTRTLTTILRQVVDLLTASLWPELARLDAQQQLTQLRQLHSLLLGCTAVICISVGATLWFEGAPFITFWTRGKLQPDQGLLRFFLAYAVFQVPWLASSAIQSATNRNRTSASAYFVAGLLGIVTAALLIRYIGARAIPLGLALGEFVACYHFVIRRTCEIVGEVYFSFALRLWSAFSATCATALGAAWLAHSAVPNHVYIRLVVVGVCSLVASLICFFGLFLRAADRAILLDRRRLGSALIPSEA